MFRGSTLNPTGNIDDFRLYNNGSTGNAVAFGDQMLEEECNCGW